jgi:hypothetical protein
MKYFLERLILFFGDYEFVPLAGSICDNVIKYTEQLKTNNLITPDISSMINKGNKLVVGKTGVAILRDNKKVGFLKRKAEIFNFSNLH